MDANAAASSNHAVPPSRLYSELMSAIRDRFDVIENLGLASGSDFARAEGAAFHGRKIVEGIAFGCLVAVENGLKQVHRDAKGQWNAEKILENLHAKGLTAFPSPSILRQSTEQEAQGHNVKTVVEGVPELRITTEELITIYQRLHRWLHELNPYVTENRAAFYSAHGVQLWEDLRKVRRFVERHFIAIRGEAFFCVLWDKLDNKTKVVPLSKLS